MINVLKGKREISLFAIGLALIALIPILVISIAGIRRNSREMQESNLEYWKMIVQDITFDMDRTIKEYDNLSMSALLQENLLDILYKKEFNQVEYAAASAWLDQQMTVELFLNQSIVSSFQVMGNNGFYYTSDRETTLAETMALAQKIEKSGQITIFIPNTGEDEVDRGFVTIGRYIYSYKDLRALGYFLMSIRSTELDQIWENKDLSRIRILVLDEDGRAVYGTPAAGWEKEVLPETLSGEAGFLEGPKESERNLYIYQKSDYTGWTAVAAVPRSLYRASVWNLSRTFMISGLIAILLTSVLSFFLIRSVYVTQLENQKNEMERSRAEMKALQTQINPHFLYNTLGAVNMYSVMEDTEAVQDITDALSKMFRYAVQNPMEPVKITEEINHVRNYLKIQEYRLGAMPRIQIELGEAGEASMLRLCLQPIVENIFKHAFSEGIKPEHFIRIHAFRKGDMLLVDVTDNGRGPSLEVNSMEYVSDGEQNGRGIGLSNVHRRLKLAYGESYGLWISGRPQKGMTIEIRQPFLVKETEKQIQ